MKDRRNILQQVLDYAGLEEESLPRQSLVELLGSNRALIENHRKVASYCPTCICIHTSFGMAQIIGSNLQLRALSGRKLLITGQIDRIDICRRKRV